MCTDDYHSVDTALTLVMIVRVCVSTETDSHEHARRRQGYRTLHIDAICSHP